MSDLSPGRWVLFRRSVAADPLDTLYGAIDHVGVGARSMRVNLPGKTLAVFASDVLGTFATLKEAERAHERVRRLRFKRDEDLQAVYDRTTLAVRELKEGWAHG